MIMVTVNSCENEDCINYERGQCTSFWGIDLDISGECLTFDPKPKKEDSKDDRKRVPKTCR